VRMKKPGLRRENIAGLTSAAEDGLGPASGMLVPVRWHFKAIHEVTERKKLRRFRCPSPSPDAFWFALEAVLNSCMKKIEVA